MTGSKFKVQQDKAVAWATQAKQLDANEHIVQNTEHETKCFVRDKSQYKYLCKYATKLQHKMQERNICPAVVLTVDSPGKYKRHDTHQVNDITGENQHKPILLITAHVAPSSREEKLS